MSTDKFADDGISIELGNLLEERVGRIRAIVDKDEMCTRETLANFVYSTTKAIRKQIAPEKGGKRAQAWTNARGMLKSLVHFDRFSPAKFDESCICMVVEKQIFETLDRYKTFVLTGEVTTKHPPPKLLGETDEILCVDKPCGYICQYGGDWKPPERQRATSASALLNGDKAEIQIHEYLCLKYNYETAVGTREWWKLEEEYLQCICGKCGYCACTQGGCCNRLDKETSGVLVCAKTTAGYTLVRSQFASEHSVEKGGTEKFYLALAHGTFLLPSKRVVKSDHWNIGPAEDGRLRVEVTVRWNGRVSVPFDKADETPKENAVPYPGASDTPQWAVTFFEPVAYFSHKGRGEKYTLLHVQIITGRRHQIRFHAAEAGFPLVGDPAYGAPQSDRDWAKRVYLHSYISRFREPFTERWFQAMSPLPQDLGALLDGLTLTNIGEKFKNNPIKSRRSHEKLHGFMKQYDPSVSLLNSHDAPKEKPPQLAQGAAEADKAILAMTKTPAVHRRLLVVGRPAALPTPPAPPAPPAAPAPAAAAAPAATPAGTTKNGVDWNAGGWGGGAWSDKDRGDTWSGNNWQTPATAPVTTPPPTAAAEAAADDSDDAWGDWEAPKDKRPAPAPPRQEAPPPKRQRIIVPPENANRAPTTPQPVLPQPVAAPTGGWKRMESRSSKGVFYYWNQETGQTEAEPPKPWEKKASRSNPNLSYYWNPETGQTSVEKPEV